MPVGPYAGNPAKNPSLSPNQIAGYWLKYGSKGTIRGASPTLMTAIALAESSGNPDADNGTASGLWQINYHAHTEWTAQELKDPATNAKAAKSILESQGLTAWVTYQTGAYKQYMVTAAAGVQQPGVPIDSPANSIATPVSIIPNPFSSLDGFLKAVGDALFTQAGWMRILKFLAGVFIGAIAIKTLFQGTPVGDAVGSVSKKATEAAEAAAA